MQYENKGRSIQQASLSVDSGLWIRNTVSQVIRRWYWFVLSAAICLLAAFVYLRYSTPEYMIGATILVKDDKKGIDVGEAGMLENFGLLSGKSNVDNEVEILKSRTLLESVVRDLQLYVKYYVSGRLKTSEIYDKSPFSWQLLHPDFDSLAQEPLFYTLQFPEVGSFILTDPEGVQRRGAFGDTLTLPMGPVVIRRAWENPSDPQETYTVSVSNLEPVMRHYRNTLKISVTNKQVSMVNLSMAGTIPKKGEDIINKLIANYLKANVDDKNRIADSTMAFIDERLTLVSRELSGIEKEIEGFKTSNRLTDISEQAKLLLNNTSEYARELTTQEVQLSIVQALEKFLQDNMNNSHVVPSSLVMQDPNFIALLQSYNALQIEREKRLMSTKPGHPIIKSIDNQLQNLRQDLLNSISSVKRGIIIGIQELKRRTSGFQAQIEQVPVKERIFLDYSRQQEIKQQLYLFLLTKREETAISKSSTLANARIIDEAKADTTPFKPRKPMVMLLALLLGLALPVVYFYVRDLINVRIQEKSDVLAHTAAPVIAEIGHNKEKNIAAVRMESKGYISEQFRALRTNLQFLFTVDTEKVILLTSSMSGEGKSFAAINLCSTLALTNKKVILLELDLRKPKISDYLNLKKEGFTNYAITDVALQDLIQPSGIQANFHVLSSGPLPPNPAELVMLPKVQELFDLLRQEYDYIVIDTAPVGLVTDAQLLARYTDVTLYLVRQNYTFKHQVQIIEELYRNNKFPKLNLIINDINPEGVRAGYGYGYNYAYGYAAEEGK